MHDIQILAWQQFYLAPIEYSIERWHTVPKLFSQLNKDAITTTSKTSNENTITNLDTNINVLNS